MRVGDLEGQVRDLMFYLDTQNKVEQSAHREDIMVRVLLIVFLQNMCDVDAQPPSLYMQGGTIEIESKPAAKENSSTTSSTRRKGKGKRR